MAEELDFAFERLRSERFQIEALLDDEANEATARLKAIDPIITTVLGWDLSNLKVEETTEEGGRIDYLLSSENRSLAVIEAKRPGHKILSGNLSDGSAYKLSGPAFNERGVKKDLEQAARYAQGKGVQLCALTNGFQWIVFLGNRIDGRPFKDGFGFVFQSLSAIEEKFQIFWNLLSLSSIKGRRYISDFKAKEHSKGRKAAAPKRLFRGKPGIYTESGIGNDLSSLLASYLKDITGNSDLEFRKACFVESKESQDAQERLERITRHLTENIVGDGTRRLSESIKTLTQADVEAAENVLIVGIKGCGKTTFIHRFFEDILPRAVRKKCFIVSVDVGQYVLGSDIGPWLAQRAISQMEQQLGRITAQDYNQLRGALKCEYDRLKNVTLSHVYDSDKPEFYKLFGIEMERKRRELPLEYLQLYLSHICEGRSLLPILIFDNADHYSTEVQEVVFQFGVSVLRAESISRGMSIVPVTEETLSRELNKGTDSAFESYFSTKLYLRPPPAHRIVDKRLEYLQIKLSDDSSGEKEYRFGESMRFRSKDLGRILNSLRNALMMSECFTNLINHLSNGNVRKAFEIFNGIIGSDRLGLPNAISALLHPDFQLPDSNILNALILGKYKAFRQDRNPSIVNIFNFKSESITPLLALRILTFLRRRYFEGRNSESNTDVLLHEFFSFFSDLHVDQHDLVSCSNFLLSMGLIEGNRPENQSIEETETLVITLQGRQHIRLAQRRQYVSLMSRVTDIYDEDTFFQMKASYSDGNISELTRSFITYCIDADARVVDIPSGPFYKEQSLVTRIFERVISKEENLPIQ